MKILFVSSGNSIFGINPIVKLQGDSLIKNSVYIHYYTVKGKGFTGYLRNIKNLKRILRENCFDIIHAHYAWSGILATLSGAKPLIVSLMGSEVIERWFYKYIIRYIAKKYWDAVIVKSQQLKNILKIESANIIPNGVDLDKVVPIPRRVAQLDVGWDVEKKHILFGSNPERVEKNFDLAKRAIRLLNKSNLELHYLTNIPPGEVVSYINASDVVLLTSIWEGSPNIVKEAMACNCPIVATDVGDIRWLMVETPACYITTFDPKDVADKLQQALKFTETIGRTKGRERILHLGLDSETVAKKILNIYKSLLG